MALIRTEIKIPEIERTIPVQLYFPTDLPESVGNKVQGVITLLHGMSNTGTDWMAMSAAPRYAADNGYILIAPDAQNSLYMNAKNGSPYFTALTEHLPSALRAIYHIPDDREMNFIAGNSMGGFGATAFAMNLPQRYAACGSFSGILDLPMLTGLLSAFPPGLAMLRSITGEEYTLPKEGNLPALAKNIAKLPPKQQPRFFATCGSQDTQLGDILTQNRNFYSLAKKLELDYTYYEWDGVHEWNFWDRSLAEFIGFIQNSNYGKRKRDDWNAPIQQLKT